MILIYEFYHGFREIARLFVGDGFPVPAGPAMKKTASGKIVTRDGKPVPYNLKPAFKKI